MTVFVIDQSDGVRARLVARLRELDFNVVGTAATLASACEGLASTVPQAIITDLMFPDARGIDVVVALRERAPSTVLVVLTNETHYRRTCLSNGADHFLDKSTELDQLATTLRR